MLVLGANPISNALIREIQRNVGGVGKALEGNIARRAPVDTHALQESMTVDEEVSATSVKWTVYSRFASTNEYGLFQDQGAGPYVIEAKGNYSLSDGENFFGPRVNHPGYSKHVGWFSDAPWREWVIEALD